MYLKGMREFGLSPSSRAGLSVEKKPDNDGIQEFMNFNVKK